MPELLELVSLIDAYKALYDIAPNDKDLASYDALNKALNAITDKIRYLLFNNENTEYYLFIEVLKSMIEEL